ncbi:MAG: CoB--CoM heterodisulfide reductase iron-sulfur subunit B family protein [archaeon GB-1867-035]|nr:CoB--CoM heterodisulfide reductase iron-sulfur subunit B family protein [Candidatus Culexmicrobium profundum]
MMSYSLFLGCYIPAMQPFAEAALRKIAPKLNINLIDIVGATCCPVPEISRLIDYETWLIIAARNLALAEANKKDILTLCNGCWETLMEAREELLKEPKLRSKVNEYLRTLNKRFVGSIEVKHFVQILVEDVGLDKIKENIKIDLGNLRVAVHPGCKLYKSENERFAQYLKDIVKAIGVQVVEYDIERVCCGYPLMLASVDKAINERSKWKLDAMKNNGADCIIVVCPACYDQFEKAQLALKDEGLEYNLPVLHLSELLALAFGLKPEDFGLNQHGVSCEGVLEKLKVK